MSEATAPLVSRKKVVGPDLSLLPTTGKNWVRPYLRAYVPDMPTDGEGGSIIRLRNAYKAVADDGDLNPAGKCREKFIAVTLLVEKVRLLLGYRWAHIPLDELRDLIITCAKRPDEYGGDWKVRGDNNHGAARGWRERD